MQNLLIRPATAADAAACAAIYAPFVRDTIITFEEQVPSEAEMATRIRHKAASHGWLVATDGGQVLGFAYASTYREREAWQWVCETTIYLDPKATGRGLGRQLYGALIEVLGARGFRVAIGSVALPNPASIALHEALGFTTYGISPRVGYKFGQWIDVAWLQRDLGEGTTTGPVAPPTNTPQSDSTPST